ncbi:helix-turn-helix transcriptional regulator [Paenibacillus eucommiae]|uniref:ArsR family transcriptional regulator n=1 Tax=Paenibacillus eucommiae TaxID=1355755 RepID=A0ABS4IYK1_9BACL|nr:metalloregulator ArsR/SmtB family transcription factor [Paenibacillus eucommiae]MBP1992140.1 putative ArsR family transcriptional regulator [Paenibacillus eucommiae]
MKTRETQGKAGKEVKAEKASQAERTSRAIVKLLKQEGPMDALQLAPLLGVSGMAVRQHLYNLQEQKLVTFEEEPRSMGRPAKMWRLTPEANRLFPDGHADLTVSLIHSMREAFGEEGLNKLLEIRNRNLVKEYQHKAPLSLPLSEQLKALAEWRTTEGYMAETIENADGSFYFIEKHCPICAAAQACAGICSKEKEMLQQVLGDSVAVERNQHILSGSSRCVYRIIPKNLEGLISQQLEQSLS